VSYYPPVSPTIISDGAKSLMQNAVQCRMVTNPYVKRPTQKLTLTQPIVLRDGRVSVTIRRLVHLSWSGTSWRGSARHKQYFHYVENMPAHPNFGAEICTVRRGIGNSAQKLFFFENQNCQIWAHRISYICKHCHCCHRLIKPRGVRILLLH
jgi:hypothetical protein